MKYIQKLVERINKEETKPEVKKQTSNRGMIKVSGIIHRR